MTPAKRTPAWRRYLRFWGSNLRADVDDELEFHVDMRVRDYMARGMDEAAARAAVARRVGDVGAATDECLEIGQANERRGRQADLVDSALSDLRYAMRSFARTPGWTLVALLTIALGIGASTSVLSVVDALLLRPIAYPSASRVATIRLDVPFGKSSHAWAAPSPSLIDIWRNASHSIESIVGYGSRDLSLAGASDAGPVHAAGIDEHFLAFAGAVPLIGRGFSSDDELPGAAPVAVLSESYWQRQYGGSRNVIGQILHASEQSFTIVGVMPAAVRLPDLAGEAVDVWLPLPIGRGKNLAGVVVRLRPGVSVASAESELDAIMKRSPANVRFSDEASVKVMRPSDTLKFRRTLEMLTGAVALLLLVACANVSHLLLARGTARERELAVRFALGADRSRLIRQLLTESLLLAFGGGVLASAVGATALAVLRTTHPPTLSAFGSVRLDRSVFVIAAVLTSVTGLAIGLLVGWRAAHRGIAASLRLGGGDRRGGTRLRSVLVVSEIALSATLLVGSLLLVRTVIGLQSKSPGFDTAGLYAVTVSSRGSQINSQAGRTDLARQFLERVRRLPGVASVTLSDAAPFKTPFFYGSFETPDHAGDLSNPATSATNSVSPDFFSVLGIRILAGRTFDAGSAGRNEVIIDETLAKQLWPAEPAVGKRFRIASTGPSDPAGDWWTVIGVTHNIVTHGLLDDEQSPTVFTPLAQPFERGRATVIARWSNASTAAASLRRLGAELTPASPPPTIVNIAGYLADSIAEPRFSMIVLTAFAGLAVLLAAIGLYGVVSYSVSQRTREIGIRMTLGATRRGIASLVVGDGLRLTIAGIVAGLAGAIAATRVIQLTLYGVGRGDPVAFAAGAVTLLAISLVACVVPVMRATAVDPAIAVRAD